MIHQPKEGIEKKRFLELQSLGIYGEGIPVEGGQSQS